MKSGHTIQLLLSWMITWISAKFQALGMLLLCLLFLMFIDYITGMLASRKEGIDHPDDVSYGWRSQKGFWGIIKKTGCWMVIASAFSVDELLLHSAKSLGITYPGNLYLGVFVTVWYSLNEVLSIIENAGRMGVPIPQKLKTSCLMRCQIPCIFQSALLWDNSCFPFLYYCNKNKKSQVYRPFQAEIYYAAPVPDVYDNLLIPHILFPSVFLLISFIFYPGKHHRRLKNPIFHICVNTSLTFLYRTFY